MATSTQELLDLIPAYTRGELDADQSGEIEALITSYLDGLLDAETEEAMGRAIEANPVLGEEVEKARRGKNILAELFPPATEPLEDPDSPEIQQYIDDIIAKAERSKEQPEEAKVVPSADRAAGAEPNLVRAGGIDCDRSHRRRQLDCPDSPRSLRTIARRPG